MAGLLEEVPIQTRQDFSKSLQSWGQCKSMYVKGNLIGKGTFSHVYTRYEGNGSGRVSIAMKSIIPATREEASWF
jgi:hypothetical protein